jgi:putative ABC transport system permease protein
MNIIGQDLKYATRTLAHSPGFAAAALISLALGIGANTAIFTLTNAVFLHSLPVKDPSRVLQVFTVDHATRTAAPNLSRTPMSYPNFVDFREQNQVFTSMAAFTQGGATLIGFGKPIQQAVFLVSANYFDVLGIRAAAGRIFRADEDRTQGANNVVVLSYSLAQRLFGSPNAAVGRKLDLNNTSYEVVGVAPPSFKGTFTIGPLDVLWVPLSMHSQIFSGIVEQLFNDRRFRFISALGRLRPGVNQPQALAALRTIASNLEAAYPRDNRGRTVETSLLNEAALGFLPRGQTTNAALALSAAVGFVLLIACANIANLSLARATKRSKEMGVRVALGATRGRLVRQLLTEAELLAITGGVLGIGIGWLGARALWAVRPAFLLQSDIDLRIDGRVLLFTAGLSVLTGLLFGIAPLFRVSSPDVAALLNSAVRGNVQGGSRNWVRSGLVVCEIALALIALAGAGLFIRSMQRAQQINLGFETQRLCIFTLDLASEHMTPEQGKQFERSVLERVRSVPGVASAAVATNAPLGGGFLQTTFREGDPVDSRAGVLALTVPVSSGYFETLRIPLLAGRPINDFDRTGSKKVAVISEAMAREMWPGQQAVGKRFHSSAGQTEMWEVVGVTKNTTVFQLGEKPQPVAYFAFDQSYQPTLVVHVRTSTNPELVLPSAMAAVQSLNRDLALLNPRTMRTVVEQALWAPHMAAALFGLFGVLSLILAVIGVYGVMAYIVLQRTTEIGVRMALGAHAADVLRMIVGQTLRLAGAGVLVGVAIALALTRLVANLLFDVSPHDPATYVTVAAVLAGTALLAALIPASRAARIDPVRALRQE